MRIPSILMVLVTGAVLPGAAPVRAEVSFAISPALLELDGNAGDTGRVDITVSNRGDAPFDAVTDVTLFQDMTGDRSALDWSTLSPRRLQVDPGSSATATYVVEIPRDARSGGRYVALTFSTVPDGGDPDAAPISGRIVVPVLLTVQGTGELVREPSLERAALFLETDGSLGARAEVIEGGNVHVPLIGRVEVTGPELPERAALGIDMGRVLPGATRVYAADATLPLSLGATYDLVVTMGPPDAPGSPTFDPVLRAEATAEATPVLELLDPSVCEDPAGLPAVSTTLSNTGSLGVVTTVAFQVQDEAGSPVITVPMSGQPLAWPDADSLVRVTLPDALDMGSYTLVAGATYATGDVREARLPFTVGAGASTDMVPCAPDVLPSPAPPG